jgi:1-deoxy-D-xylulose-5-phosphate synthase
MTMRCKWEGAERVVPPRPSAWRYRPSSRMARLLDRIQGPQDLHSLSEAELQQVAQEIRESIIDTVGEIGGHFGANLGTCELAVALHSLLDSQKD